MAEERLKIIYEEKDGKPTSYQYLEKSESKRAINIIEALNQIDGWIPVSELSRMIKSSRDSTTRTINKIIGAEKITPTKHQASLLFKNSKSNPTKNLNKPAFYKATQYVRIRGKHK